MDMRYINAMYYCYYYYFLCSFGRIVYQAWLGTAASCGCYGIDEKKKLDMIDWLATSSKLNVFQNV